MPLMKVLYQITFIYFNASSTLFVYFMDFVYHFYKNPTDQKMALRAAFVELCLQALRTFMKYNALDAIFWTILKTTDWKRLFTRLLHNRTWPPKQRAKTYEHRLLLRADPIFLPLCSWNTNKGSCLPRIRSHSDICTDQIRCCNKTNRPQASLEAHPDTEVLKNKT